IGISKLERDATSYCPAWLENSWLILSRTSFSGSTVKFTLMPVALVKLSAVSFCRSTIWGLFTMSTLMLLGPPPPGPPPQPAQPLARSDSPAAAATTTVRRRRPGMGVLLLPAEGRPDRRPGGRRRALPSTCSRVRLQPGARAGVSPPNAHTLRSSERYD